MATNLLLPLLKKLELVVQTIVIGITPKLIIFMASSESVKFGKKFLRIQSLWMNKKTAKMTDITNPINLNFAILTPLDSSDSKY